MNFITASVNNRLHLMKSPEIIIELDMFLAIMKIVHCFTHNWADADAVEPAVCPLKRAQSVQLRTMSEPGNNNGPPSLASLFAML